MSLSGRVVFHRLNHLILVTSVFAVGISTSQSQDFKADLRAMYESYATLENVYADIEIEMFADSIMTAPMFTRNAQIRKQGSQFLYSMDEVTSLFNERFSVIVNSMDKTIVFKQITEAQIQQLKGYEFITPDLDSMLLNRDSVKFNGLKPAGKHYVINSPDMMISQSEFFLDEKTHLVNRIVYQYNPKVVGRSQKVVINYQSMNLAPEFPKGTFSESNYIVEENSQFRPSRKYHDYSVIHSKNVFK